MADTAATAWRRALESWAIPPDILSAAPESPFGFPVAIFSRAADDPVRDTPSRRCALEALRDGDAVLDVGCGAGAASLACVPPAGRLVGVDESAAMLEAFSQRAGERAVSYEVFAGRWPAVASDVRSADVVLCHHVFYNVADLAPFATALHSHARRRVVVELTASHPLSWMNPLWHELQGVDRPSRPTADDAEAVLGECGFASRKETTSVAAHPFGVDDDLVASVRRRLCLPSKRDDDVRAALTRHPTPSQRELVTLWWDA